MLKMTDNPENKQLKMPSLVKGYVEGLIGRAVDLSEVYDVINALVDKVPELENLTIKSIPNIPAGNSTLDMSADYNKELGDADSVAELVTEKTGIEFSRHVFQTDPLRKGYISHKFRSHKYGIARIKLDSYRRE